MIGMTKEVIDAKDGLDGTTALMNAAKYGHGEIVELLLDKGADVDVRSDFLGFQAIHYATFEGHLDVAKLIANKNPEVLKARTKFGETPLEIARVYGRNDIVNWLQTEKGVKE